VIATTVLPDPPTNRWVGKPRRLVRKLVATSTVDSRTAVGEQPRLDRPVHPGSRRNTALERAGTPVSYSAVAHAAGIARSWLYTQQDLRAEITRLREATAERPKTPPIPAIQRASEASLRRRLELAQQRIRQLSKTTTSYAVNSPTPWETNGEAGDTRRRSERRTPASIRPRHRGRCSRLHRFHASPTEYAGQTGPLRQYPGFGLLAPAGSVVRTAATSAACTWPGGSAC
jgi:hypothetical protein